MPKVFDVHEPGSGEGAMGATRSYAVLLIAAAMASLLVGCSYNPPAGDRQIPAAGPAAVPLRTVPDLHGKTLLAVRQGFIGQELTVTVTFPSDDITFTMPAEDVAGTHVAARIVRLDHKGSTVSLVTAADTGATFLVRSQSPAPGTRIEDAGVIRIVTAAHPGNRTGMPWAKGHSFQIKSDGSAPCMVCHSPQDCADCHTSLPPPHRLKAGG